MCCESVYEVRSLAVMRGGSRRSRLDVLSLVVSSLALWRIAHSEAGMTGLSGDSAIVPVHQKSECSASHCASAGLLYDLEVSEERPLGGEEDSSHLGRFPAAPDWTCECTTRTIRVHCTSGE